MNKKFIYLDLIVIIFILTKRHLLARDDDDEDNDKSRLHAKRPLVITGAEPDIKERLILIMGRNFSLGNQFKGLSAGSWFIYARSFAV